MKMRFLLCFMTAVLGLASAPERAFASVELTLHTGKSIITRTYCTTPWECVVDTSSLTDPENLVFSFNPASNQFCRDWCYDMSVFGSTVDFRAPLITGVWGPSFTLVFDHDLGGVFPWSWKGFLSGQYDRINELGRNTLPQGAMTLKSEIIGFTITGIPGAPAIPEPTSWGMMILGLAAIGAMRRRRAPSADRGFT